MDDFEMLVDKSELRLSLEYGKPSTSPVNSALSNTQFESIELVLDDFIE
jgi:hypothetical protein